MSRLIDADALATAIYEWIVCSECGKPFNLIDNCTEEFNYCPNCGADMRGEE